MIKTSFWYIFVGMTTTSSRSSSSSSHLSFLPSTSPSQNCDCDTLLAPSYDMLLNHWIVYVRKISDTVGIGYYYFIWSIWMALRLRFMGRIFLTVTWMTWMNMFFGIYSKGVTLPIYLSYVLETKKGLSVWQWTQKPKSGGKRSGARTERKEGRTRPFRKIEIGIKWYQNLTHKFY